MWLREGQQHLLSSSQIHQAKQHSPSTSDGLLGGQRREKRGPNKDEETVKTPRSDLKALLFFFFFFSPGFLFSHPNSQYCDDKNKSGENMNPDDLKVSSCIQLRDK